MGNKSLTVIILLNISFNIFGNKCETKSVYVTLEAIGSGIILSRHFEIKPDDSLYAIYQKIKLTKKKSLPNYIPRILNNHDGEEITREWLLYNKIEDYSVLVVFWRELRPEDLEQANSNLCEAAFKGDEEKLITALYDGADINYKSVFSNTTPVKIAREWGHENLVNILSSMGADMSVLKENEGKKTEVTLEDLFS